MAGKNTVLNVVKSFVYKYKQPLIVIGLLFVCYFLFFYQMGAYPLIDVDESRYVTIAKDMFLNHDYMTLKLDQQYFFEKPPLYFWLAILSFKLFGQISEFTARFPVACLSTFACFFMYYTGKRFVSIRYALVSTLICITGFEFLMLSRIAILDSALSIFTICSIYCGYTTLFTQNKTKSMFWVLFYLFSASAVMSKGIPGVILPVVTVYGAYTLMGKFKEIFNHKMFVLGWVLFFAIALPWHILMLKAHNPLFFDEYIVKHHLARFFAKEELGRKESLFFFIPVFLVGFIPWIFSLIGVSIEMIAKYTKPFFSGIKSFKIDTAVKSLNNATNEKKFLFLNIWAFAVIFLFFSSATTKLPTYILPAMFPAAFITGYFWTNYIFRKEHKKAIEISSVVLFSILAIAAIAAIIVPGFLPEAMYSQIKIFQIPVAILLFIVSISGFAALANKKRKAHFFTIIIFMIGVVILATNYLFNFMVSFGERDLINYAKIAKQTQKPLATFAFGQRFSTEYYYDDDVDIQTEEDFNWLKQYAKQKPNAYIIVKNKNSEQLDKVVVYKTISKGVKYTLITSPKFK